MIRVEEETRVKSGFRRLVRRGAPADSARKVSLGEGYADWLAPRRSLAADAGESPPYSPAGLWPLLWPLLEPLLGLRLDSSRVTAE